MDPGLIKELTGLALLFAAWGLIYAIRHLLEKRRSAALEIVAQQMGFLYLSEGQPFQPGPVPRASLFSRGRKPRFRNLLTGYTANRQVTIFDYQFVIGRGKNTYTMKQTVAAYRLPHAVANFEVSPASAWAKLSKWFGGKDIRFPENPQFSKRFRLRGPDEPAVRKTFSPAVQSYFEAQPESKQSVQTSGGWLIVFQEGHRVPPPGITNFLAESSRLASGLADILIQSRVTTT